MTKGAVALMLMAVVWSGSAFADPAFDGCMKVATTNVEFDACGQSFLQREDSSLNQTWKQVMARAGDASKKDLVVEQRAWLKFRDASCMAYANRDEFGREGTVIHFPVCRAQVVIDRVRQLEAYRDDFAPK